MQYTLFINNKKIRYKAHRLVALLFIPNKDNLPCVNHKDGNKMNNNVNNLEWCTVAYNNKHARDNKLNNISANNIKRWSNPEIKKRISKKFSQTITQNNRNKGENNPNFKYRIYYKNKIITRTELSNLLGISQSFCDSLIRKATKTNVDKFSKNNIQIVNLKESQQTIERII